MTTMTQYLSRTACAITLAVVGTIGFASAAYAQTDSELLIKQITQQILEDTLQQALDGQTDVDANSCRNSQIISYTPIPGSRLSSLDAINVIMTEDTNIEDIEITINGTQLPFIAVRLDDNTYQVFAAVPENVTGNLYVDFHASSDVSGSCNDILSTSYVSGQSGMTSSVAYTPTVSSPVATTNSTKPASVVRPQVAAGTTNVSTTSISVTDIFDTDDVTLLVSATDTDVLAQTSDGDSEAFQTASVLGSLVGLSQSGETCNTVGAIAPWYVYVGFVWLWLVLVWVLVSRFAEPVFGSPRYISRLRLVTVGGTAVGIVTWFVANPCFTNAWLPVTVVVLGGLLYWLYAEDVDVYHGSSMVN